MPLPNNTGAFPRFPFTFADYFYIYVGWNQLLTKRSHPKRTAPYLMLLHRIAENIDLTTQHFLDLLPSITYEPVCSTPIL